MVAVVRVAKLLQFRCREVPVEHTVRRNGGTKQACIEYLVEILEPREKKPLVVGPGNGAAEGTARVIVLVLGSFLLIGYIQRVIGVQHVVAGREERAAVILLSPGLRNGCNQNRSFLVLGAEVRGEHPELLKKIRVRVHRGIAVAARIGYVRTVRGDVQRVTGETVISVGVVQR